MPRVKACRNAMTTLFEALAIRSPFDLALAKITFSLPCGATSSEGEKMAGSRGRR